MSAPVPGPVPAPVLAIETSTPLGGVALLGPDGLLAERALDVRRTHGPRLMQAVEAVLGDAGRKLSDLAGIGVSVGPGSFTGLRVGVATAQGMARGAGLSLFPVPTLEALAWGVPAALCPPGARVATAVTARKGELYGAVFAPGDGRLAPVLGPLCASPEDFAARLAALDGPLVLAGTAAPDLAPLPARVAVLPALFFHPRAAVVAWRARVMAEAGAGRAPGEVVPRYLARSQAERKAAAASGGGA